jgi:hypothetical protein
MTVPLKKIRTRHKFFYNGVLFRVVAKRAYGKIAVENLDHPEPLRTPYFDKETPVEPAD